MTAEPLPLESSRWAAIQHAYGPAGDTPALVRELLFQPNRPLNDRVWNELWSSLCHQGTTYEASFAAMPYLAMIAERARPESSLGAIHLMVAIAVSTDRQGTAPSDLVPAYNTAVARLPDLAVRALPATRTFHEAAVCCGAILAGRGHLAAAAHVFDPLGDDQYVCPECDERLG
jgi:hypothetical protein